MLEDANRAARKPKGFVMYQYTVYLCVDTRGVLRVSSLKAVLLGFKHCDFSRG